VTAFAQALEPFADGVLFAPVTRDSSPGRISQPRVSLPPAQGPITQREKPASQLPTTALQESDLLADEGPTVVDEDPTMVGTRFSLQPPPPPLALVGPRPSRGVDVVPQRMLPTQRMPRPISRKRKLALAAALFAIGAAIPTGLQLADDTVEPTAAGALAAQDLDESDEPPRFTRIHGEAPAPLSEAPRPTVEVLAAEQELPSGREPTSDVVEAPRAPSARPRRRSSGGSGSSEAAVEPTAPVAAQDAEEPRAKAPTPNAVEVKTERNPYVRR
jgi:hypothetical protein